MTCTDWSWRRAFEADAGRAGASALVPVFVALFMLGRRGGRP